MNDNELRVFGERIKELRAELNLSQALFVENLGITTSALSAYENGTKNPSVLVARKIADKYKVSMDWLCGLSERMFRDNTVRTYSEVIQALIELDKKVEITISENKDCTDEFGYQIKCCTLNFADRELDKHLANWSKYKKMLRTNTIDSDIYDACINKLLKDSDKTIKNHEQIPFN